MITKPLESYLEVSKLYLTANFRICNAQGLYHRLLEPVCIKSRCLLSRSFPIWHSETKAMAIQFRLAVKAHGTGAGTYCVNVVALVILSTCSLV